jgi:S1-C subfamily serine protease
MLKRKSIALVVALAMMLGVVIGVVAQDQIDVLAPLTAVEPYQPNAEELGLSQVYSSVVGSVVNVNVAGNDAPIGTGSGFVIDAEGHIVTNNHVVEDADYIEVSFVNGTRVEAELVGRDPSADLAVVQIDPNTPGLTLQPVSFADSDQVFIGEQVMAIGSPFGEEFTLTTGIVSALERTISGADRFSIPKVIQTDAAINPGNSGGPLLNWAGQVIGVNTAILSASNSGSGVGFSIPSNTVRRIVPYLIEHGEYQHSYLGISGAPLLAAQRETLNLPADFGGVVVGDVVPQGPADLAGVQGSTDNVETPFGRVPTDGDIITAINGQPVTEMNDLIEYLEANTQPGNTVTLSIVRDGQPLDLSVILQARPQFEETLR